VGNAARARRHRRAHAPLRRRRAIDLSLTDRGLLDLDVVFVAAATLSFAAGLAYGRLRALVAPVALTTLVYLGVERGWWGGGFVDGWERAFAFHTLAAMILGAIGVAVRRAAGAVIGTRLVLPRWGVPVAALSCAALAIGAFWYVETRPPDVTELRSSGPLYYLGESFEKLRLTHAEASSRGAFFAYGGCDTRIGMDPGGCSVPLQLQNVTCPGERTTVAIFGGGGGLARRAARALRSVEADAPLRKPRVAFDRGARCTR
jgi:hypothetical protein